MKVNDVYTTSYPFYTVKKVLMGFGAMGNKDYCTYTGR